jgi:transcriptional regulator with XRE-family HTH domain
MTIGPGRKKRADSQYASQAAELATRLRALRLRAELTQEQLAVQAGIALSTLRKIETGKIVEPGYFTILAMLRALGIVQIDELTANTAEVSD